jgi:NAD-dependent dihydropyrimidine dehydrogenase PreA subunit
VQRLLYLSNVVTLELDVEQCIGCGMCVLVCPHDVFSLSNGHADIACRDACMECGACAKNCPTEAVTVETGVGCAAAVINALLGRESSLCCCVIEPGKSKNKLVASADVKKKAGCC